MLYFINVPEAVPASCNVSYNITMHGQSDGAHHHLQYNMWVADFDLIWFDVLPQATLWRISLTSEVVIFVQPIS